MSWQPIEEEKEFNTNWINEFGYSLLHDTSHDYHVIYGNQIYEDIILYLNPEDWLFYFGDLCQTAEHLTPDVKLQNIYEQHVSICVDNFISFASKQKFVKDCLTYNGLIFKTAIIEQVRDADTKINLKLKDYFLKNNLKILYTRSTSSTNKGIHNIRFDDMINNAPQIKGMFWCGVHTDACIFDAVKYVMDIKPKLNHYVLMDCSYSMYPGGGGFTNLSKNNNNVNLLCSKQLNIRSIK